jgi:hypothetical protein
MFLVRVWRSESFKDCSLSMIESVTLGVCFLVSGQARCWDCQVLVSSQESAGGVVFDKYLLTATVCTLSLTELVPYVLLLTAAYEVAGWKDCQRVQLRSDTIDPIGAQRTPLSDIHVIMGTRSRLSG